MSGPSLLLLHDSAETAVGHTPFCCLPLGRSGGGSHRARAIAEAPLAAAGAAAALRPFAGAAAAVFLPFAACSGFYWYT